LKLNGEAVAQVVSLEPGQEKHLSWKLIAASSPLKHHKVHTDLFFSCYRSAFHQVVQQGTNIFSQHSIEAFLHLCEKTCL
jgi:hypothetical protein